MKKFTLKNDPHLKREQQKYEHPVPSREYITQYLEHLGRPATFEHLINAFALTTDKNQDALRRRLKAMLRDGQLMNNRRGSVGLVKQMELIRGRVAIRDDGFGIVIPDDGGEKIYLGAKDIRSLFNGDRVLVSILKSSADDKSRRTKSYIKKKVSSRRSRREGVLVEIIERSTANIVGQYLEESGVAFVAPSNKNSHQDIIIPADKQGDAKPGQIVAVEIIVQPNSRHRAIGKVIEVLGDYMAAGLETEVAIRAYDLPYQWSEDVVAEAQKIAATQTAISNQEIKARLDLQNLPLVTIDGEDAKDFDDAVYVEKNKNGFRLVVAIADVSHYVSIDSALDDEALKRGNSVYFPGQVLPMLPEILSNDLCSLKPNVPRLAMVCDMEIDMQGKINHFSFHEAVIKSQARLTYNQVYKILKDNVDVNTVEKPVLTNLQNLFALHKILKKARQIRGALEFSSTDTRIVFGKNHKIKKIVPVFHNFAHEMIEECMLAANVCTSKFLLSQKLPSLFRVHEGPDADKIDEVRKFLSAQGLKLTGGKEPEPTDYAKVLQQIKDWPNQHVIQTVLLRSLKQAVYTTENVGHFGLAYTAYSHFTSPIRRYPDLINHRAIRYAVRSGKSTSFYYEPARMENFGTHCSMTERRADDATRDVINWLKCEYMRDKLGASYHGVISGVTNFGIFVELKDVFVEGLVHITDLRNDYYHFDPIHFCLTGKRTGTSYQLGDPIQVRVVRVDLDTRKIDFELFKQLDN